VDAVSGSNWALRAAGARPEARRSLAQELGLTPEILEQAAARAQEQRRQHGRQEHYGVKRKDNQHDLPQIDIRVRPSVRRHWDDYCRSRHIDPTTAVRSLVHEYLLDDKEPAWRDRKRWVIEGKYYAVGPRRGRLRPLVTRGAAAALRNRTEALGVSLETLVRGLMCEAMAGRRLIRNAVAVGGMYNDPKRYRLR